MPADSRLRHQLAYIRSGHELGAEVMWYKRPHPSLIPLVALASPAVQDAVLREVLRQAEWPFEVLLCDEVYL